MIVLVPVYPLNAGALVVADIILSHSKDAANTILEFVRERSNNAGINFDPEVAESEKKSRVTGMPLWPKVSFSLPTTGHPTGPESRY